MVDLNSTIATYSPLEANIAQARLLVLATISDGNRQTQYFQRHSEPENVCPLLWK